MKFLCLHGMGTNSSILEAQFGPICAYFEAQGHEFVFVDGLMECKGADVWPGIKGVFPGPYLCYYELPTPENVQSAFDYVNEVIEEEGPFDGAIGFSQGAALLSSMMLEHSKENPVDDLFKCAIFAAASLPFDLDDNAGVSSWANAVKSAITGKDTKFTGEFAGEMPAFSRSDSNASSDSEEDDENHTRGYPMPPWVLNGQTDVKLLGRYHPDKNPNARIRVPTVHLIGDADHYKLQCDALAKLCTVETSIHRHAEGHRIPRDRAYIDKVIGSMDAMISKVQMRQ